MATSVPKGIAMALVGYEMENDKVTDMLCFAAHSRVLFLDRGRFDEFIGEVE